MKNIRATKGTNRIEILRIADLSIALGFGRWLSTVTPVHSTTLSDCPSIVRVERVQVNRLTNYQQKRFTEIG
jgi:hypothetical protein